MSEIAWRIVALFFEGHGFQGGMRYIAGWTLGEMLGQDAATIQAAHVRHHPENKYEQAMKELVSLGLIEELPDLGERWRLVVK
jgi:hypothetical protein